MLAAKLYGSDRLSSERAAKLAGCPTWNSCSTWGFTKYSRCRPS